MAQVRSQKYIDAFLGRAKRDNVQAMSFDDFGQWINKLPRVEFLAMISLSRDMDNRKKTKKRLHTKPNKRKRQIIATDIGGLCNELLGVAAFSSCTASQQESIYRAVRTLQTMKAAYAFVQSSRLTKAGD